MPYTKAATNWMFNDNVHGHFINLCGSTIKTIYLARPEFIQYNSINKTSKTNSKTTKTKIKIKIDRNKKPGNLTNNIVENTTNTIISRDPDDHHRNIGNNGQGGQTDLISTTIHGRNIDPG